MDHRLLLSGRKASFTSIAIPVGLDSPSEEVVEEASRKDSNLLLSISAGGRIADAAPAGGMQQVIDYISAAGTDVAALAPRDIKALWLAASSGTLRLPFTAPDLVASNASVSDERLGRLIRPYSIRKLAGHTAAFISLLPQDPEALAEISGAPVTLWNPRDEEALSALIREIREKHKADLIVAVAFFRREDFGWLTSTTPICSISLTADRPENSKSTNASGRSLMCVSAT